MPLYQYECTRHGEFSDWATLAEYEKKSPCPDCGKPSKRMPSAAYLGMNSGLRRAIHASEKSADEPRVVRRRRGDAIPAHDAHRDLAPVRKHAHHHHEGHHHGTTVRSKHPWMVRHDC
jgi:putative FmdB family regulatory protein